MRGRRTRPRYQHQHACLDAGSGFDVGGETRSIAAFTKKKQIDNETARRVTRDALAVKQPMWVLGDAALDMLGWHDDLIEEDVVPVAPYNPRNTDDPLDIEYRMEDRIEEHSENVHLK